MDVAFAVPSPRGGRLLVATFLLDLFHRFVFLLVSLLPLTPPLIHVSILVRALILHTSMDISIFGLIFLRDHFWL